jgi:hypothetical protein
LDGRVSVSGEPHVREHLRSSWGLIPRALVDTLAGTGSRCLVEAPLGYGKSLLLSLVAAARDDAVWATSARELTLLERPGLVIVDQLERWDVDEVDRLCQLLARGQCPTPIIFATRWCPPKLAEHLLVAGTVALGVDRLRVSDAELVDQLASAGVPAGQAAELASLVDGWPLLAAGVLDLLAATGTTGGRVAQPPSLNHPLVADCVRRVIAAFGADDVVLLAQLAQLGGWSDAVADSLSPGLARRLARTGVPVKVRADGRRCLVEPVRRWLELHHRVDPEVLGPVVPALLDTGDYLGALRLLVRTGRLAEAAEVCAGMPHGVQDTLEPDEVASIVELLVPLASEYPRLLLNLARAHGNCARLHLQQEYIDLASQVHDGYDAEAVRREALAEQVFLRAVRGDRSEELLDAIEELEKGHSRNNLPVSTRLVESRSLVICQREDAESMRIALDLNGRAALAWRALGERALAAATLRFRAMAMLIPMARYAEADDAIRRALELSTGAGMDRIRALVVSARIAGLRGDQSRAEALAEAAALARALDLAWAEAYVHWAEMLLAGVRGALGGVLHHFRQAWDLLGDLQRHPTGALITVEAAEAAARAGGSSEATELLASVADRRPECPTEYALAELAIEAFRGDVDTVERLAADLAATGYSTAGRDWRVDLYRAVAEQVSGRDGWEASAERATALATVAGAPALARLLARERPGAPVPQLPPPVEGLAVQVLGGFAVQRDGVPIEIPGSRVAMLLKVLAMGEGSAPLDVVLDRLWPEASAHVSRRRLKNVTSRARALFGDVVVRRHERLELAPWVRVDLIEFSQAARAASHQLATGDAGGVSSALRALGLFRGPLLPDDLYDDDIMQVRLVLTGRAMTLVDGVLAASDSDLLAPGLLESVLRIDPHDVARLSALALWSQKVGQLTVARSAATHALGVSEMLGARVASADPGERRRLQTAGLLGDGRALGSSSSVDGGDHRHGQCGGDGDDPREAEPDHGNSLE